jgi:cytochrome c
MRKSWIWPVTVIAIALMVGEAYLAAPTLAEESPQYAAKPAGSDGPAGQCVVCHSIEKGAPWRVAPTLWGIVGAPKAGAKGYGYSQALATAGGTWTAKDLDEYLANPGQFLPGTSKVVSVTDARERARIIQFLGTLRD